jgi:hypothetical protein
VRVGPSARNDPPVPAQQRLGRHKERLPRTPREQAAERRQHQPVARCDPWSLRLPPQDRQLVAKDEDLKLLRTVAARDQQHQGEQPAHKDVDERSKHQAASKDGKPTLARFVHPTSATASRPLIVVGDLNDGPEAATTQILYGPPDQNLDRPDKGDPWRLVNLARFLPSPDSAFSRVYKRRGELIDHILASTAIARGNVHISIDTTHVTSIGDQPLQRKRAIWPDHAPVIASIT